MTTLELMHDPDLHQRGIMQTIEHPVRGPVIVAGWPLRMSGTKVPPAFAPILAAECGGIYGEGVRRAPPQGGGKREGEGGWGTPTWARDEKDPHADPRA